ncbi:hypothetical protein [Streptomyces sp. NBC_00859]|uniref:hypothetical protein n=1 Tax=Streptomyces sp. NBC_00859 TaxID=2903682 RepID=UPI00386B5F19|nr:hypothetical protein OG584_10690 [Streptomyces sp. NBC_00859]
MSTFLNYLTVAAVFLLLALPSLIWHARERRIDRQLAQRPPGPGPAAGREPRIRVLRSPSVRSEGARSV